MISQEEIQKFLEGNDPEEYIVSIEYDYASDKIFKIKEVPDKGKSIVKDNLIAFAWVGDLRGLNFYSNSKGLPLGSIKNSLISGKLIGSKE